MTPKSEKLYTVVHGDGTPWTNADLQRYALDHPDLNLVYCDMDGFYVDEYGDLYIADECGNFLYLGEGDDRNVVWHQNWEGFYGRS